MEELDQNLDIMVIVAELAEEVRQQESEAALRKA